MTHILFLNANLLLRRAEIIKIEHPTRGDDTRAWGPPYATYKSDSTKSGPGESAYFLGVSRLAHLLSSHPGTSHAPRRNTYHKYYSAALSPLTQFSHLPGQSKQTLSSPLLPTSSGPRDLTQPH